MNNDKRAMRIILMEKLYQYDIFNDQGLEYIPSFDDESFIEPYHEIIEQLKKIDEIIEKNLTNYRLYRLSYVDRAIIRLAVYELLLKETPAAIIINEAIELTKIYTNLDDEKQHKFNNKLLDVIHQNLKD